MPRNQPYTLIQQQIPLDIVGSATFGRYRKISRANTYNMIISDDFLVPFAGYERQNQQSLGRVGRGIFNSKKANKMFIVIDNDLYQVDVNIGITRLNQLETTVGDVFMAENNANEIAICDQKNIYIYNYSTGAFTQATLNFVPNFVAFQDDFFIATVQDPTNNLNQGYWQLSAPSDGTSWPHDSGTVGGFRTKADVAVAAVPMPGKGNMLLIFGTKVTELWTDVGLPLFPYQKNTSYNLDYGCFSSATIAWLDEYVVWLAGNEQAGPTIMYTNGGSINKISTDGIDFKLAEINFPEQSTAFLFRQDGHLLYVLTFYNAADNLTLAYDFNTQKFFTLTDGFLNYFIAKKVVYFNGDYYFIAINDGHLYKLSSDITTYNGTTIPRIRICGPKRNPDQSKFIINNISFTVEQGEYRTVQAVDLSLSKDGGQTFSSADRKVLNTVGNRPNRLNYWNLGAANDLVVQIRFYGEGRFIATDGIIGIYQ